MSFKEMLEKIKNDVSSFVTQFDRDVKKLEDQMTEENREAEITKSDSETKEVPLVEAEDASKDVTEVSNTTETKKQRGRPKKNKNEAKEQHVEAKTSKKREKSVKKEPTKNETKETIGNNVSSKKRGRPKKSKTEELLNVSTEAIKDAATVDKIETIKVGNSAEDKIAKNTPESIDKKSKEVATKKRGRPAKNTVKTDELKTSSLKSEAENGIAEEKKDDIEDNKNITIEEKVSVSVKKRGRPAKNKVKEEDIVVEKPKKKRGRPKKTEVINEEALEPVVMGIDEVEDIPENKNDDIYSTVPQVAKIDSTVDLTDTASARATILNSQPVKKRGRPKKAK